VAGAKSPPHRRRGCDGRDPGTLARLSSSSPKRTSGSPAARRTVRAGARQSRLCAARITRSLANSATSTTRRHCIRCTPMTMIRSDVPGRPPGTHYEPPCCTTTQAPTGTAAICTIEPAARLV
jgi:hypothetical protein